MHVLPNANQGPSSIKYSSIVADKGGDALLPNNKGQHAPSDLVVPGKKNL
jgi:hypothetical protein